MRSNSSALRSATLQLRLGLPADRKSAPVETYIPGQQVDDLKARFKRINEFIIARGGWVVSVPGDTTVIFEVLPESTIPDELIGAGHHVLPGEPPMGERILPHAITQRLALTSSGAYEALVPGSTKAVAHVVRHAGIVRVLRFRFSI